MDNFELWYRLNKNRGVSKSGTPPLTFKSNGRPLKNYRIYGNTVNGESVGDLVTEGEHAGEYCVPVTISRKAKHTATLQLHDCLPSTMQFDAPEALYYAENGLSAGTYCFTIQNYDTAYGGGKTYNFTLTYDVPVGGQLTFSWGSNVQASDAKISSYASAASTTAIEQVSVTEGNTGISLGTTDGSHTNVNHIHRVRRGSNNYAESAIRQFLNSSSSAGSVWTPQTKFDRPPSWNALTAGFMKDIDSEFLTAVGTSHKVTALNNVTDNGGSIVLNDMFFLLSVSETYGSLENNVNEGEPYPYYSNNSDLSMAGTDDDSNRIKYRNSNAQTWWLRSPYASIGSYVRGATSSGNIIGLASSSAFGIAPACNIELDDNYAYNGQVLHVRDQISVQKGNNTLIFDVIGIDHDDVDFDVTTTSLYLSEQIKMLGDEAEYVDYGEQKQHRVRKNLLQNTAKSQTINGVTVTINEDKSITLNSTSESFTRFITVNNNVEVVNGYILSGCPNISVSGVSLRATGNISHMYVEDTGDGIIIDSSVGQNASIMIRIPANCTCDNLTFYPMIRKASIEDDTYEPYINDTELDVTLPALPTLSSTNTLSVGTEVQPSSIEITTQDRLPKSSNDYFRYKYDIRSKGNAGQF